MTFPTVLGRLKEGYRFAAVILLNFLCLVLLLNLALAVGYWAADATSSGTTAEVAGALFREDGAPVETAKRMQDQLDWFDFKAYDGADAEYVGEMLDDFYDAAQLGFVYQPWVQFSEAPYNGKRVNIDLDEMGFPIRRTLNEYARRTHRVVRIFAFGGSTTFGYNVSDEHTWPSFLSRILNERALAEGRPFSIEVMNYGRAYFHPTQETMLLADLLRSGHRPSLAIFMDGVNWGGLRDVPDFSWRMAVAFVAAQHGRRVRRADFVAELRWVPMVRLASSLDLWLDARVGRAGVDRSVRPSEELQRRAELVVARFEQSSRMARAICGLYGCRTLLFLQPNAHYGYNLELYRRELPESFTSLVAPTAAFYGRMRQSRGYVDLADLFRAWGLDRKAIVDHLHYSPGFNRLLAEHVAAHVDLGDLAVFADVVDASSATGVPRSVVMKRQRLEPSDGEGSEVVR